MSELIPIPKDPRHVRFADFILDGVGAASAYRKAGYTAKNAQVASAGSTRLLKNVSIATYLSAMRQKAAAGKVLTMQAKREFLCRIVTTPLMGIDPRGPDGDLILRYKNTITDSGGSEEIVKLDPLKAIDLDNKLSGDDPESAALGSLAQALAGLGGGMVVGDDRM
jgi:hypothetical protein